MRAAHAHNSAGQNAGRDGATTSSCCAPAARCVVPWAAPTGPIHSVDSRLPRRRPCTKAVAALRERPRRRLPRERLSARASPASRSQPSSPACSATAARAAGRRADTRGTRCKADRRASTRSHPGSAQRHQTVIRRERSSGLGVGLPHRRHRCRLSIVTACCLTDTGAGG